MSFIPATSPVEWRTLPPNIFLNGDFSLLAPELSEVSSLKSGEWLVSLFLRFLKNKKSMTNAPKKIHPPIEPTNPPISFAFLGETEPEESELDDVDAVINVVMVVSASLIVE